VTPLRNQEYLISKVLTLTLLSLLENLAIVALTYGFGRHLLPFLVALLLAGTLYALFGFIFVVRYESINEYLLPSVLFATLLSLPMLPYLGVNLSWLIYLHPLHGALFWLTAAFQPLPAGQLIFSLFYSLAWIAVGYHLSRRAFYRFVIIREGVR
jgi:fluoroquinolone transport system permease protein